MTTQPNSELFGDGPLALALDLYEARRNLGHSHGAALYATVAGYARAVDQLRTEVRPVIEAALRRREVFL